MGMLAKIRRMHIRDGIPLREIARQTGLSRNTIRTWLRQPEMTQPQCPPARPKRPRPVGRSTAAMAADRQPPQQARTAHRPGHVRKPCASRLPRQLLPRLRLHPQMAGRAQREPQAQRLRPAHLRPRRSPFQFDWSCEYTFIGGLRRRLEVAHIKLCASRLLGRGLSQPEP